MLNTASPGRSSAWILPSEMMTTPDRPTSSGLQSPSGIPVQFGPSPLTQEYCRPSPCCVPPAQWGNHHAREPGEEECELFGDVPPGHEENPRGVPSECEARQNELDNASTPSVSNSMASNLTGPRCINGQLVRQTPPSDYSPSTACQASTACAPVGVTLGQAAPGFGTAPPPPEPRQQGTAAANPMTYPREWTPLHTRRKSSGGGGPPEGSGGGGTGSGAGGPSNPAGNAHPGGGGAGSNSSSGGGAPPGGGPTGSNPGSGNAPTGPPPPPGSTPAQPTGGAGNPGSTPPTTPPIAPPAGRTIDPWASLDRSRKPLPKLSLPSSYKNCSILDAQQMLEVWYDKSTFAIAT